MKKTKHLKLMIPVVCFLIIDKAISTYLRGRLQPPDKTTSESIKPTPIPSTPYPVTIIPLIPYRNKKHLNV